MQQEKASVSYRAQDAYIHCCRFGSRPHGVFSYPTVPRKLAHYTADLMAFVPAFKRVIDECAVPGNFQAYMVANSILDADRFMLACPHGVDRDLIEQCSLNLSISDKIVIRYAHRCCRIAAEDAERSRIAAAASPGTADIPTETLKDVFERRHAYMLLSKRLLNDSLVKELYHGWHKHPKQLKFYLPRQLLITNTAEPVANGRSL